MYTAGWFNIDTLFRNTIYKRSGPRWSKLGKEDIALITGGSNGLGLELVKHLLLLGVKVVNIDKTKPDPNHLKKHENLVYYQCDLNDLDKLAHVIQQIQQSGLAPTILINNAAIRHNKSFLHMTTDQINTTHNVNLQSSLILLKSFLKEQSQRFYVVNIASVLGLLNPVNLSIYSLTKAALISIHESLSYELSFTNPNIRFLLVLPGQLNTTMFQDVKPPKQFFAPVLKSEKLARAIIEKIQLGERGELYMPLFARFVPLMRMLPQSLRGFLRWITDLDTSVHE
ncbi:hypothetical protein WICPIJ_005164 [Wickerhamomyces pijperi]|uniref:Uncharacterized protein n=1 Tax=Wickerhamomyces pijperi TaxID=599730 RepID=A0A9P8Q682_WICPI|nr:hypothetical protein WICPIJ_005164 [Wickerhamomyces pijperi]